MPLLLALRSNLCAAHVTMKSAASDWSTRRPVDSAVFVFFFFIVAFLRLSHRPRFKSEDGRASRGHTHYNTRAPPLFSSHRSR